MGSEMCIRDSWGTATSARQATFIHIWISPVRCPRRMQSSISSQKTPKYKKLSRKRKTAQNLSILSCFMMECRWWDSNPHGFPNDFESFASAIPPHRLIFNFGTLVPVSEDWRDVQEGCKKSCFNKLSKFNEYSWISCTDTKNHEADFESPSSAIPTHRRIGLNVFYYTGFPGQNQEKVCVFFQIVPHGVKYMTPVLARRRGLCYTKVRSKRK